MTRFECPNEQHGQEHTGWRCPPKSGRSVYLRPRSCHVLSHKKLFVGWALAKREPAVAPANDLLVWSHLFWPFSVYYFPARGIAQWKCKRSPLLHHSKSHWIGLAREELGRFWLSLPWLIRVFWEVNAKSVCHFGPHPWIPEFLCRAQSPRPLCLLHIIDNFDAGNFGCNVAGLWGAPTGFWWLKQPCNVIWHECCNNESIYHVICSNLWKHDISSWSSLGGCNGDSTLEHRSQIGVTSGATALSSKTSRFDKAVLLWPFGDFWFPHSGRVLLRIHLGAMDSEHFFFPSRIPKGALLEGL